MPATDPTYHYADYSAKPDPSHRPLFLATALSYLSKESPKSVLDAGCGGGDFSVGLHQAGYQVYGIDASESGIRAARARGIGGFAVSSLYESLTAPFGVSAFDAIVAIEVIEHLYSPRTFVGRAREALLPGALMIVTTPYWGYAKNLLLALTNRTDRALTANWEGGHIKHFSRRALIELMTGQGFAVEAFVGAGQGIRGVIPGLWSNMLMVFRKSG